MAGIEQLALTIGGVAIGTWLYFEIKRFILKIWRKSHPVKVIYDYTTPTGIHIRKERRYRDIKDVDVRP